MPASAPQLDSLLAHEGFVRQVVRALLHDEASVQDAVQETWLRVLRKPPKALRDPRAWLARVAGNAARDQGRSERRRQIRQAKALDRDGQSVQEDVAQAHARLSAQRGVVDAVLALDEPYRGVVLLHHFEGRSVADIASQKGSSPSTVRSQLSRAHAKLRERLDEDVEGGRAAWAALAVARGGSKLGSLALGGLVAAGALGVLGPWAWSQLTRPSTPAEALSPTGNALAGTPPAPAPPASRPAATSLPTRSTAGLPQDQAATSSPHAERLIGLGPAELYQLSVQVQRRIFEGLVRPRVSAEVAARHAGQPFDTSSGIARLVDLSWVMQLDPTFSFGSDQGYGAISFLFNTQRQNNQQELAFSAGSFRGVYGESYRVFVSLGDRPLEDIAAGSPSWLAGLSEEEQAKWRRAWSSPDELQAWIDGPGGPKLKPDQHEPPQVGPVGGTWLLRSHAPEWGVSGVTAFRVIDREDHAITIAWRVLQRWATPKSQAIQVENRDPHVTVPDGPQWIQSLTTEDGFALLASISERAEEVMLEPTEAMRARGRSLLGPAKAGEASGTVILQPRDPWSPQLDGDSTFSSINFTTLARESTHESLVDLILHTNGFRAQAWSRQDGLILDLGPLLPEQLQAVLAGNLPGGLSDDTVMAWEFLRSVPSQRTAEGGRLDREDAKRAEALGLRMDSTSLLGHAYLLRTTGYSNKDRTVVFAPFEGHHGGFVIAYRVLEDRPVVH